MVLLTAHTRDEVVRERDWDRDHGTLSGGSGQGHLEDSYEHAAEHAAWHRKQGAAFTAVQSRTVTVTEWRRENPS